MDIQDNGNLLLLKKMMLVKMTIGITKEISIRRSITPSHSVLVIDKLHAYISEYSVSVLSFNLVLD